MDKENLGIFNILAYSIDMFYITIVPYKYLDIYITFNHVSLIFDLTAFWMPNFSGFNQ